VVTAAAELGACVTKEEARRLRAGLDLGQGLMHQAVRAIHPSRRARVQELLESVLAELGGDVSALTVVLDALSGVIQGARPQLVWTSPSLPSSEGHTTLAVSELINQAQTYVYAATYSAGFGSAYVTALRKALERGVKVTVVVDREKQGQVAAALAAKLVGARIWTLREPVAGEWAVQHAKLVMIDGLAALVTSANFSTAAAESNLECGVLLRDAGVASSIKEHLDRLREADYLVDYAA
jgi:phosphatidylserine/phosphatidylglycerophosphate/cardiolipin synthase-like enzyme